LPIGDVDELISLIYQGPLEAQPWQGFLQALRRRLNCEVAAMTIRPNGKGIAEVFTWDSDRILDDAWREQHLDGVLRRLRNRDPLGNALTRSGSLYTLDEVLPRKELVKSEFYRTLMKPYGIEYQLGMCFCEPSGWKCNIGVINGPDGHNFGDEEKTLFRSFHPHLERALELYARLTLNESEKRIFEDTLDRLTIGTSSMGGVMSSAPIGWRNPSPGSVAAYLSRMTGSSCVRATMTAGSTS
jgi:hypothetical protein